MAKIKIFYNTKGVNCTWFLNNCTISKYWKKNLIIKTVGSSLKQQYWPTKCRLFFVLALILFTAITISTKMLLSCLKTTPDTSIPP